MNEFEKMYKMCEESANVYATLALGFLVGRENGADTNGLESMMRNQWKLLEKQVKLAVMMKNKMEDLK